VAFPAGLRRHGGRAGPDTPTQALAASASRWTILKSGFTTISMVAVIALLVVSFIKRQRRA